jgi:S-adenosylmethionine:tRNA ribosyltransferase-isomerase
MDISEFDYDLPPALIAQKPLERRDGSRMLVVDRESGKICHSSFLEFPNFLANGDILVVNDTKVIPARILGKKGEAAVEFLFLREIKKGMWEVLCRPAKKVREGDVFSFSSLLEGKVFGIGGEGKRILHFPSGSILPELKRIGFAPLPPYIKRLPLQTDLKDFDRERYQTVFARSEGAIAAPTAGLHFTPSMIGLLEEKSVRLTRITLDVGLATFQPVRVQNVKKHTMLSETYSISRRSAQILNEAKSGSKPVTAVGTTTVRTLESAFYQGKIRSGARATELFIYPGFKFQVVDRLLTNFHLPKSTLLMMIAAFAGHKLIIKAYREAVNNKYRFYSYGDCMLIL